MCPRRVPPHVLHVAPLLVDDVVGAGGLEDVEPRGQEDDVHLVVDAVGGDHAGGAELGDGVADQVHVGFQEGCKNFIASRETSTRQIWSWTVGI